MRDSLCRVLALIVPLAWASPVVAAEGSRPAIGDRVEDHEFKDTRYLARTLDDFGPRKAFVLVAVRTSCPLAGRYLPVLAELERTYREQGVQFLALGVAPTDSLGDLAAMAIDAGAEFPLGKDDGSWVRALGWRRTPEVVVLDASLHLRYRGRIDDQFRLGGEKPAPGRRDLVQALDAVLGGHEVETPETPSDGCLIPATAASEPGDGPTPTFAEHVEPILQKHCQRCHRPGTETPFALVTYQDAVGQAETLAEVVTDRRMPPWYGVHDEAIVNRQGLSDRERDDLLRWVRGGKPKGDPARRPARLVFPDNTWRIGPPDLVITMVGGHEIPATGLVDYRYTFFPHLFLTDTWVQGVEILPDNPRVIHHANLFYARGGDKPSAESFITGKVPGGDPMVIDPGIAYLIPAGSVLGIQIHFTTTGKPERCRISVGLKFARGTIQKRLYHSVVTTTQIKIPPFAPAHAVAARRTLPFDATLLGVFAHMHVRGKDMDFLAQPPGAPKERLLLVANYNFDWQLSYRWGPNAKHLPRGTILESLAHFDNSAFNPYNPDPSATVGHGLQSSQEMMMGYYFYTRDDEDLDLKVDPKTGRALASKADGLVK